MGDRAERERIRLPRARSQPAAAPSRRSKVAKRAFDLCVAVPALVLLSPFLLLVAAAIQSDSTGPALYLQLRSGRGRRTFRIYKFRTMVANADELIKDVVHLNVHADPRLDKIASDPRVTRVGRVLRRCSLDELPQLFNVVKGDMSLVGRRPLMLAEDQHVQGVDGVRAAVRPGITGPWQVQGRNDLSFEEMMTLDRGYVETHSLIRDLRLLLQTVPVVLHAQRAC